MKVEPPALANQATIIIEGERALSVSAVVLAEVAYVLRSLYNFPRTAIVDGLVALVSRQNITPYGLDRALVVSALLLCRASGCVSFPDALVWAEARTSGANTVFTFDQQFPHDDIEIRGELGD